MKRMVSIGVVVFVLISGISVVSIQDNTFESMNDADVSTTVFEGVETCCTDGIDNDGDGLVDNEDGDCWIKEAPIYETHPCYYNGTFRSLTEQIPKIADSGVKTIYMMPIWEHEPLPPGDNNYRYGFVYHILDYYKISPEFGTERELKELINSVHENNMKIIFDLTATCTFKDSEIYKWSLSISLSELKEMDLKLEYTPDKKYVFSNCRVGNMTGMYESMVFCDLFGEIVGDEVKLFSYPAPGFGYAVDKTDPEVVEYFTEVAEYYVKEYDIDGWRIDAPINHWNLEIIPGDHSSTELLRSAKKAVLKVKPDAVFYSESPSVIPISLSEKLPDPVLDEMCEASYSYYFSSNIADHKTSELLVKFLSDETIWHDRTRSRFAETHDTSRINDNVPQLNKPLLVLISTIPGVPMIQAGQEVGATNAFLPDAPVDWANGDYELRDFYKKVFTVRNNNNALKYGTIENIWESGDDTFAYLREFEGEKVIVIVNFLEKQATSTLNLSFLENGTILYDGLNNEAFMVSDPCNFSISIPAYGYRILFLKEGDEPIVYFEKPKDKYLYIFDREIMPSIFGNTIILGKITIEVDAYDEDGVEKVEFYVDNELKYVDDESPYQWLWDERTFGRHEIKAIAYDEEGNKAEDEIDVTIFNI